MQSVALALQGAAPGRDGSQLAPFPVSVQHHPAARLAEKQTAPWVSAAF